MPSWSTKQWRGWVLLAVIAAHLGAVYVAIRATPSLRLEGSTPDEQITWLYLPRPAPAPTLDQPTSEPAKAAPARQHAKPDKDLAALKNRALETPLIIVPSPEPSPPSIDWDNEAKLAAQNALKPDGYRNLSGLSPQQLKWITDNQFVPAPPGIAWRPPVLDHTLDGRLIIHLGDRCVIVPPLPMVFCKIGWMH